MFRPAESNFIGSGPESVRWDSIVFEVVTSPHFLGFSFGGLAPCFVT